MYRDGDVSAAVTASAGGLAATVAVGSDAVAGGRPLHTLSLGLVGVVVAVLRIRLAGRHRGLFATLTASFVAQPVLHAATKLLGSPIPAGAAGHSAQHTSSTALPVLVAAAIVVAVACAERLLELVGVRRVVGHRPHTPRVAPGPRVTAVPVDAATPGRGRVAHAPIHRRGPPVAAPVLAA